MANNLVYDNENNHTLSNAQTVTIDDIVYGKIASSSEIDFYRIVFNGSGKVTFRLNIPANAKYYMRLMDANVNVLAEVGGDVGVQRNIEYSVEANVPYIVRINASNSTNIVPNAYYNLQFIPKVATNISINLSKSITFGEEPASYTYAVTPSDAYVDMNITNTNNNININSHYIQAVNHGMDTIVITDNLSGICRSADIMSMPTPEAVPQKASGYCFASCLHTLDKMWGGTYNQDDPGIRSDGKVLINNSIVRWELGGATCQSIKNAIDEGNYCLVYITGRYEHWVIAYYASSASTEGIKVIDTNHPSNSTLAAAMDHHGSNTISQNRITYKA